MQEQLKAAFAAFEARLHDWAQARADVRAVVVIGSRGRRVKPADAWSDLDLILLVDDPAPFIDSGAWLADLGEVQLTFLERTPNGQSTERRALFARGVDVDFVPLPAAIVDHPPPEFLQDVVRFQQSGVRLLVDKDDLAGKLASWTLPEVPAPEPLREEAYLNTVNDFWYHCVWVAKKLLRGEQLTAMGGIEYLIYRCILPLTRTHTAAAPGAARDTWHGERFFEEWADPRIVTAFARCFPTYAADSLWQALFGCMDLFAWLAPETGQRCGFTYPTGIEAQVRQFVAAGYAART